ncbi:uncharacterized protein TNCV_3630981 [Trichonephila clavipes]|nr:uncharacterized protein TNCV_3630981 [Trichonephila clavipes]
MGMHLRLENGGSRDSGENSRAELILVRKLITPFQKHERVTDGAEFMVGNIEKLFKETRKNTRNKHEKWAKYYNRRREVNIKVNDLVLVETHPISSVSKKVAAKFKPKNKGPFKVLSVQNNNVVIWKVGGGSSLGTEEKRLLELSRITESSKGAPVYTYSEADEKSPGKPVSDLQEEQCKPWRNQSASEETNSEDQASTTSDIVGSPDKVTRSLRRV